MACQGEQLVCDATSEENIDLDLMWMILGSRGGSIPNGVRNGMDPALKYLKISCTMR